MPVSIGVTLFTSEAEPLARLSAVFSDDDWALLGRFVDYEAGLLASAFVREGMPHDFSLTFGVDTPPAVHGVPPDAQIREFLHLMRPFILQDEPTFYGRVQGIVGRALGHPMIRGRLGRFSDLFHGRASTSFMKVQVGDLTVNSGETLDLWLNAFEYHRDQGKLARLQPVIDAMGLDAAKAFFIDLLVAKAEAVQGLAALIRDMQEAVRRRSGWVA